MPNPSPSEPDNPLAQPLDEVFKSRMDRLRLRHLRLLDRVALSGSLSAAAQDLGMSQPGATKMLQELEQAFGCVLIERSARGGALTQAGRHVLDRMRIALHALRTARSSVDFRKEMPLVRLGIIPLVGIHALSEVVGTLQSEDMLPRLQIQLGTVESLLQALGEGRVDGVVGFLDETASLGNIPRFHVTPLWQEKLVVVASRNHPLARRKKVTLEMAREHDWVMMPKPSSNRRAVERLFLGAGLAPPIPQIETESFHISLSIASGSQMLAVAPQSAYRQYQSETCMLPMEAGFPATTLVFVTLSEGPMLPAVQLLSEQFQAHAQKVGASI